MIHETFGYGNWQAGLPPCLRACFSLLAHKSPRKTVLVFILLTIFSGTLFNFSEKPALIKTTEKPARVHPQS